MPSLPPAAPVQGPAEPTATVLPGNRSTGTRGALRPGGACSSAQRGPRSQAVLRWVGGRLRAAPAPRTRPRTVSRRAGPGEEPPPSSVIPVGYALPRVVWTASSLASSVTAPWVAQAWRGAGDGGCPPRSTRWPACDPPTAPAPGVESLCVPGPHDSGSCYTRSAQPYKPAVPGPGSDRERERQREGAVRVRGTSIG